MSRDTSEDDARLGRALAPWLAADRATRGAVLLAVSGGPDSTALLHAAADFRDGTALAVATIDHGLRPGSADEADAVGERARRLGLTHAVLRWVAPRRTGIQAAARAERYRLLARHAASLGAQRVLTAHTRDDQAETVLMRLLAGSGPAGLAGMRRERALAGGVRLARPFLDLRKTDLVAYCERHRLPFVEDPSNSDDRFVRARLRRLMPALAAEGLRPERLCRLAERLARDDTALALASMQVYRDAQMRAPASTLVLDGARLCSAPPAIAIRVIDLALDSLQSDTTRAVPHRLERLERLVLDELLPALRAGAHLRRTLRGRLIEATPGGSIRLAPAPARRGAKSGAPGREDVHRAAGASDLLGNAEGAAYIGSECPE